MSVIPRVDVGIPVYRPNEEFLREQAQHLAESAPWIRSIHVSIDEPNDVVALSVERAYAPAVDAGIHFKISAVPEQTGMIQNWNRAVEGTTGCPYVVNLGQDDVLPRRAFVLAAWAFARFPEASFVALGRRFIDDRSCTIVPSAHAHDRELIFEDGEVYLLDPLSVMQLSLGYGQVLGEPSHVFLNQSAFKSIGGYNAEFRHNADLELLLRMVALGPGVIIGERCCLRRLHSRNATWSQVADGTARHDRHLLFDRYSDRIEGLMLREANDYLLAHDVVDGLRHFRRREVRRGFRVLVQTLAFSRRAQWVGALLRVAVRELRRMNNHGVAIARACRVRDLENEYP